MGAANKGGILHAAVIRVSSRKLRRCLVLLSTPVWPLSFSFLSYFICISAADVMAQHSNQLCLPSDPQLLLSFMEDLKGDNSDEDFDGYLNDCDNDDYTDDKREGTSDIEEAMDVTDMMDVTDRDVEESSAAAVASGSAVAGGSAVADGS